MPSSSAASSSSPSSSGSSSSASSSSGLWRDGDFRRLWLGQTASQLGEQASLLVLPLFAVLTLGGTFGQLVNVTLMAVRQTVTPDAMQGRAAATINCVGMGLAALGSLLGGFLAEAWGTRTSLLVTAAGMHLSPALMALSPLARLGRTLPPLPQASTAVIAPAELRADARKMTGAGEEPGG